MTSVDNPAVPSTPADANVGVNPDRLAPGDALVIGVLLSSTFVVLLSEMVMGVAIPRLMVDLNITASTGQWLTTGYLLTMAVVIPACGFVMQRFRLRSVFITAMGLFVLGAVIAAAAPGFGVLLTGRVVQATGTAIMMPLLMTTVMNLAPRHRHGRMMAFITIVGSAAPAAGPAVSGLILSPLSWRWLLLPVLPVALLGLLLGAWKLRNVTPVKPASLDVASLVLSALGFGSFVYGLATLGDSAAGHPAAVAWACLIVGVAVIGAFVRRQLRLAPSGRALLDLQSFAIPAFARAIAVMVFLFMAAIGTGTVLPLMLQNVIGVGTLETGLLLAPGGAAIGVVSMIVGRFYDRIGARPLVIPGALVVTASTWFVTTLDQDTGAWVVMVVYLVICSGQALMWTPLFTSALSALPPELYPHGSAIANTIQQLAGAAGIAVLIAALTASEHADESGNSIGAAAAGVQGAFVAAGVITLFTVFGAVFVLRRSGPPQRPRPTAV